MEWKKNYTKACIDAIQPQGDVLLVGFEHGYAATFIQKYSPVSLTILERDPDNLKRVRAWAQGFRDVTIIPGCWRHTLTTLGKFDAIFFDSIGGVLKERGIRAQVRKVLVDKVFKKLSRLREIRYTDSDMDFFLKKLERRSLEDKKMLPRFFSDLYQQGQITQIQWKKVCDELDTRGWVSAEEIAHQRAITRGPTSNSQAFCSFLKECVDKHMKPAARVSCYLETPTSKFEDPYFYEQVILNPKVDYREVWMDLPSEESLAYGFEQALVITITLPQ